MKFSEIIGNRKAIDSLRQMKDSGAIPHALLLHGPSGTGKMLAARTFAQYVHCRSPKNGEPCGECPSCRFHHNQSHPDLHYVYPVIKKDKKDISEAYYKEWTDFLEREPYMPFEKWVNAMEAGSTAQPKIYVSESAEILRKASLSAYASEMKIFLVWLPEKMNADTANKLLKILEEPYSDTLFVMVSDAPQDLLGTILSRTQGVQFKRLTDDEVVQYLVSRHGMTPEEARETANVAGGSLIKAGELLDAGSEMSEFRPIFQEMMRKAYMRDVSGLKTLSEKVNDFKREKIRRFLSYCSSQVRENFIYNLHNPALNAMTRDDEAFSQKFSPFINPANVEEISKAIAEASRDIERNGNGKIICLDFMLQVMMQIRKS